jgi:Tol biopolymer transport system component
MDIYGMAPDGRDVRRLTSSPESEEYSEFTPDGRMQGMIRVMNADGTGDRAVTALETRDENPMRSPDGRHIILQSVRDGNSEVCQVDLDGLRPVRLTGRPAWDGWACYLPAKI